MKRLQDQARTPLRHRQPDHRADDRSIAMPPENGSLDAQRVQECDGFLLRPAVKIERHLSWDSRRVPISRAIRNQYPKLLLECFDLLIKRINLIPPTAMEKNQRSPAPKFPIVNRYGANLCRMGRVNQLERRHLTLPRHRKPGRPVPFQTVGEWTHARYLTTENSPTQATMPANLRRLPSIFEMRGTKDPIDPHPSDPQNKNGWQGMLPAVPFLIRRI
jgi:hypothetical protein